MKITETKLKDCFLIEPNVFQDNRGFFLESYSEKKFKELGITTIFRQDNHSMSLKKEVLRGLHFQLPPHTQTKLVRVTQGSVFDVAVDLRKNSPTFGKWAGFTLTADNFHMLYIPQGFAHGFCTLEDNTEFMYKNDNFYTPDFEGAIRWDDPQLNIDWPVKNPVFSDKDAKAPYLKDFDSPF
jgi:dTDP-4-dehydrorhamnose 3,5-epimerase